MTDEGMGQPARSDVPGDAAEGPVLTANVVAFGRLLRRLGLAAGPGETRLFLEGISHLGVSHRQTVKAAGRAVFVSRRSEISIYDAAFDYFWRRSLTGRGASGRLPRIRQQAKRERAGASPSDLTVPHTAEQVDVVDTRAASSQEVLRHADFGELTAEESRDAEAMLSALEPRLPLRRSRRSKAKRREPVLGWGPRARRLPLPA